MKDKGKSLRTALELIALLILVIILIVTLQSLPVDGPASLPVEESPLYPPPEYAEYTAAVDTPPLYPEPPADEEITPAVVIVPSLAITPAGITESWPPTLTPWPTPTPFPTSTLEPGPTRTPVPLVPPADSPAGTLAFIARRDDGSVSLNTLDVDATGMLSGESSLALSDETRRLEGHIYPSPDGSRLAWMESVESGSIGYFLDTHTGKIDPVIPGISNFFGWHPDNNHILAVNDADFGLWLFDLFGNRHTPLDVRGWGVIEGADISPDGSNVIFTYKLFESTEVWIIGSDGRNSHLLFEIPVTSYYLSWSPDGKNILFIGDGWTLLDSDGINPRRLTVQVPITQCYFIPPLWSPDSRTLAVVTDGGNQSFCQGWSKNIFQGTDIYLVDAESGVAHPLLDDGITGNIDPAWSPDGSMLAFVSNRSGKPEIWVVNADGSNLRQMTNAGEIVRFPYWRSP